MNQVAMYIHYLYKNINVPNGSCFKKCESTLHKKDKTTHHNKEKGIKVAFQNVYI